MGRAVAAALCLLGGLSGCQGTENIDRNGGNTMAEPATADFAWRNVLAATQFYEDRLLVSVGSVVDAERALDWDGSGKALGQTDACLLSQITRVRGEAAGQIPPYEPGVEGNYEARWDQVIDYDDCGAGQHVTGRETTALQMATNATLHSAQVDGLRISSSAGESRYSGYATLETYLQTGSTGVLAGPFQLTVDNVYSLTVTDDSVEVLDDPIHTFIAAQGAILSASSVGFQILAAGWEQAADAVYAQSNVLVYDVDQCPFLVQDTQTDELIPVPGFPVMPYSGTITLDSLSTGMLTEWLFQDCRMTILEDGEPVQTLNGRDPADQLILLGGASSGGFGGLIPGRSLLRLPYLESSHIALLARDWCRGGLCMQFDYSSALDPTGAYPLGLLGLRRYDPLVATAEQRGTAFNSLHVLGLAVTATVDAAGALTELTEPTGDNHVLQLHSAALTDTTNVWESLTLVNAADITATEQWLPVARAERDSPAAAPSLRAARLPGQSAQTLRLHAEPRPIRR